MSWIDRLLGTAHPSPIRASDVVVGLYEFAELLNRERAACIAAKERVEQAAETLRTANKAFKKAFDVISAYAPGTTNPFELWAQAQLAALQTDLEALRGAVSSGVDALAHVKEL